MHVDRQAFGFESDDVSGRVKESQVILVTGNDGLALPHARDLIEHNSEVHALRHCFLRRCLIGLGETEREVVVVRQVLSAKQLGVVVELEEGKPSHDVREASALD